MKENTNFPGWRMYLSQQEVDDEKECDSIVKELRGIFGSYGRIDLSLQQLRKIKDIIAEDS